MEDMILKLTEIGALGVVTLYLLTKGTAALHELSENDRKLADSINKLSATLAGSISDFERRIFNLETQLHDLKSSQSKNKD